MKKIILLFGLLAVLSCQKEAFAPTTCNVRNPLADLTWLRDTIAGSGKYQADLTVFQATYDNQTVFGVDYFLGPDAGSGTLYRCDGSIVCGVSVTIGGPIGNCGTIYNEFKDYAVIYEKKRTR